MLEQIFSRIDAVAKTVQWLVALVGLIAFLVFFALAPLHALVLCGLLVVLGSMYFKLDRKVQQKAILLGVALMSAGVAAILVPQVNLELLRIAGDLGELLRLVP